MFSLTIFLPSFLSHALWFGGLIIREASLFSNIDLWRDSRNAVIFILAQTALLVVRKKLSLMFVMVDNGFFTLKDNFCYGNAVTIYLIATEQFRWALDVNLILIRCRVSMYWLISAQIQDVQQLVLASQALCFLSISLSAFSNEVMLCVKITCIMYIL